MSNQEASILKPLVQQTVMAIITEGVLALGDLILLHKNGGHEKRTGQVCILNTTLDMRTGRESVWKSGGKSCLSGALL